MTRQRAFTHPTVFGFPNVDSTLDNEVFNRTPLTFLPAILEVPLAGSCESFVRALEGLCLERRRFVGALFSEYAAFARAKGYLTIEEDVDRIFYEFMSNDLLRGVTLCADDWRQVERVFTDEPSWDDFTYDPAVFERTVLVPSPRFTYEAWRFRYDPFLLDTVVRV